MSFRDAEASDPTLSGIAAILQTALVEPGYRRNSNQVYASMDSDPLVSALPVPGMPTSRVDLLRRMNGHRMNTYEIPDELVSFCRANLQQGPVQIAAATIGRVQGLNSLVRALVNPRSILDLDSAEALVRDLVADVVDPTTKLARQKSQLDGQTLSRFQMWSYPAADSLSPFREIGSTRAEAVNVLGLGYYADTEPNAELVRWAHTLPVTIRAHRPTAWDACADKGNVYWRPGGSTYKLHSDEYGLQEFVHNPVQGQDLTVPIEILL